MSSDQMHTFILLNILVLMILLAMILVLIYGVIIITRIKEVRTGKQKRELQTALSEYMDHTIYIEQVKAALHGRYRKLLAVDILNEMSAKKDVMNVITDLQLDLFLKQLVRRKPSLKYLKRLSLMKVPSAYEELLSCANSKDIDRDYICYMGLAQMEVEVDKKYVIVKRILQSELFPDRIIEILNYMKLDMDDWLILLEQEERDSGKSILLKLIAGKEEIRIRRYAVELLAYLSGEKEVKIAAVTALCNSRIEEYANRLYKLYQVEEDAEVRAVMARGMSNFEFHIVKDQLLAMAKDEDWRVRFNAIKSISFMGEEGVFELINLSIDMDNPDTSALAYYFLNSSRDIYNTVKRIEGQI